MPDITQGYNAPAYWQQFEDLTVGVATVLFGDPTPSKVGTPGQAQDGIDVLVRRPNGNLVGIQCKRRATRDAELNVLVGGRISFEDVRKAVAIADAGRFPLDLFVLATTANVGTGLQASVATLSSRRNGMGKSAIWVWSWADYEGAIGRHAALQQAYYASVPQGMSQSDRDLHLLTTFAEAFNRPAFRDPLSCEHPGDFLRALSDVQRAVATGVLVDRNDQLIRQAAGGYRTLSDAVLRKGMVKVVTALDRFRWDMLEAERSGALQMQGRFLTISDDETLVGLEQSRTAVVDAMNWVLKKAGLKRLP